jgi:hypothetical protein
MKIGVTGTRKTLLNDQRNWLLYFITDLGKRVHIDELHHGDCVGADGYAHILAMELGLKVIVHPPLDPQYRAFCNGPNTTIMKERDFLRRDRDIVSAVDIIAALPEGPEGLHKRSGTWYTIRYARKHNVPVALYAPWDGIV